ncbi:cbb3-type cytochrome c oxidase subunit I [Compostibacter hankyongensis]|uniref:Cbb3-type cytochrome c oxidase subunit I n=1 Tax=Compostibacter hankyongensis TaxID=1007089 RepID=A0ABP8FD70_9BACT
MKRYVFGKITVLLTVAGMLGTNPAFSRQRTQPYGFSFADAATWPWLLLLFLLILLCAALALKWKINGFRRSMLRQAGKEREKRLKEHTARLNSDQVEQLLRYKRAQIRNKTRAATVLAFLLLTVDFSAMPVSGVMAQGADSRPLLGEAGILITIFLLLIPVLTGIVLLTVKIIRVIHQYKDKQRQEEAEQLAGYLESLPPEETAAALEKRKSALDYRLTHAELSGNREAEDDKGLLQLHAPAGLPLVELKKKAQPRPAVDPALSRLILGYFGCAVFWLLFGTTVGEYLGIKFVAPDADHLSWLSFGRLRPVHTNAVFWGWASLGMLGLGYYVVPRVSNAALASIKRGWYALFLINAAVVLGSLCLMGGINNGGGEYREYIWPVMLLFALGLVLSLSDFLKTIARRTTKEIYISNWYIVSALIFALVIVTVAYVPYWQNGLGETIVQGYYMHQGVGMWFMLFTLGLVYYFLPQQLNKPIYSYSLGILAFWTQILFYTLIGTHHFVFSAIPWWLQTVAIVGSGGMIIPVVAGTTNFLMTFKGAWYKVGSSYTLPFFLVGIVFYFTGSMQGTAEAFRSTNLIWHFTDFTVAHSHLTMYGIISFFLWAGMYAIMPRLTGREAPQITVGAHFWLALIGLLFYTVPLMYGSTLKGLLWLQGKPFIDGVVLMAPYWLWRAIGGSLMWISHLFFAYNIYKMWPARESPDIKEQAIRILGEKTAAV